ncbi:MULTISPECIES: conjugal transfer protein TraI [Sphingobacterium]|uniref:conjugal transfer protein TraI n=1 Tax=Sphingobacterium TaxID=28453 RepID=UPI0028AE409B|nr:conjugal transfer protein TraI [Sphingobacterium multivorum]
MKRLKVLIICLFIFSAIAFPTQQVQAIGIAEIIKQAVVKVIKAADLKIQRLQNKTIWLQDAQKTLENILSKLKLEEISGWSEKQKEQYRVYFEELTKVKALISYYQRVKEITAKQLKLVEAYKVAWSKFSRDKHFNAKDLEYMSKVYAGILDQSLANVDQIAMIIKSFSTQMSDGDRLELINKTADNIDRNYTDLLEFNKLNVGISMERAKDQQAVNYVKQLYGIQ